MREKPKKSELRAQAKEAAKQDRRWRQRLRDAQERRRQRGLFVIAAIALMVILAFPAYGYYKAYVEPPRVWAVRIAGQTVLTMGEMAKHVRVLYARSLAEDEVNLGVAPFTVMYTHAENELIRQAAPQYGIRVTTEDLDQWVRDRFYPTTSQDDETPPEQLEREFQERYRTFLQRARLTEEEFRQYGLYQLYRERMREELGRRIPSVLEQVEVSWIVLPVDHPSPETVLQRLRDGEDFAEVAKDASIEAFYANDPERPGYVGLIPKGAFPVLDPYLFGPDGEAQSDGGAAIQRLQPGEVSDVIATGDGYFILRVEAEPVVAEVTSERMRDQLKRQALNDWIDEEWERRDVQVNFDSYLYEWLVDQVLRSLPLGSRGAGS